MPRNEFTDYTKGKIYILILYGILAVYVGSTTQELQSRYNGHHYKNYNDQPSKIILIENFSSSNQEELEEREQFYYEFYKRTIGVVNKNQPKRTRLKFRQDNRQSEIDRMQRWIALNKDKKRDYSKI